MFQWVVQSQIGNHDPIVVAGELDDEIEGGWLADENESELPSQACVVVGIARVIEDLVKVCLRPNGIARLVIELRPEPAKEAAEVSA